MILPDRAAAKAEWEGLTKEDPQPGRRGASQPWRRLDHVRAWIDWDHPKPDTFTLLNFRRIDGQKGDGARILEILKDLCDRHHLVMIGTIAPQRDEQIGNDKEADFLSLARYYEGQGIQVIGALTSSPQLRYPAGPYFTRATTVEPLVTHAREMVMCARELLDLHHSTKSKATLIGACLFVNHAIDWAASHQVEPEETALTTKQFRAAFGALNPKWNALRELANRCKHAGGVSLEQGPLEWEDDDTFHYRAGADPVWFITVDGRRRVLAVLCWQFVEKFDELFPNL